MVVLVVAVVNERATAATPQAPCRRDMNDCGAGFRDDFVLWNDGMACMVMDKKEGRLFDECFDYLDKLGNKVRVWACARAPAQAPPQSHAILHWPTSPFSCPPLLRHAQVMIDCAADIIKVCGQSFNTNECLRDKGSAMPTECMDMAIQFGFSAARAGIGGLLGDRPGGRDAWERTKNGGVGTGTGGQPIGAAERGIPVTAEHYLVFMLWGCLAVAAASYRFCAVRARAMGHGPRGGQAGHGGGQSPGAARVAGGAAGGGQNKYRWSESREVDQGIEMA